MESENLDIPRLDEMEEKLHNRVIQYLVRNNDKYRNLQNQIIALLERIPGAKELLDGAKAICLSEQEHQAYHTYRQLKSEMDALERMHFYLEGQADMKPYIQTLHGLSKTGGAESRYKINHLHLESWQMEIINYAVEVAEQEARKNCKEYGEAEKKISELCCRYPFIDSFTDRSRIKEGRTFTSEELQRVSDCLALEEDKRYIEQTELYLKGVRDGYALKKFLDD